MYRRKVVGFLSVSAECGVKGVYRRKVVVFLICIG